MCRSDRSKRHTLFRVLVPASLLFQQCSVINVEWAIKTDPRERQICLFSFHYGWLQEETRTILTVQLRSGNCTSVLIIWIPAFIKMSGLLCSVPFVNTSFPICPCWDYGCYKLTAGTSIDSPGPIYGTQLVKYWPLLTQKNVTLQAIQLTALLLPPFLLLARATAAYAVCQSSELQQTSNAPTPPTSLEAFCHSPP